MIVKAVTFFLIGMLILGMFGKLRLPRIPGRKPRAKVADAKKCPKCGGYILGEGPCVCRQSS